MELIFAPIMQPRDWGIPFEIMCNAEGYVVGAMLGQKKDRKMNAIYYASRIMDEVKINYVTT